VSDSGTQLPPAAKEDVHAFWQASPCGAKHAQATEGTPEFFAEVERSRDALEPFIAQYARFAQTSGCRVLEIGTGLGTDFVKFVRAGARATGVDLTERSISLVESRLALEGLEADLRVADAETLPFDTGKFDVVYSWGVLHHTPHPPRAIAEAIRVLRPGGRLCVMLYARRSWVAFGLWARYALLTGRLRQDLTAVVAEHMESDGTRSYTASEVRELFGSLTALKVTHHGTPYDRRVAGPLAGATGRWLGWFLVIEATKPLDG